MLPSILFPSHYLLNTLSTLKLCYANSFSVLEQHFQLYLLQCPFSFHLFYTDVFWLDKGRTVWS